MWHEVEEGQLGNNVPTSLLSAAIICTIEPSNSLSCSTFSCKHFYRPSYFCSTMLTFELSAQRIQSSAMFQVCWSKDPPLPLDRDPRVSAGRSASPPVPELFNGMVSGDVWTDHSTAPWSAVVPRKSPRTKDPSSAPSISGALPSRSLLPGQPPMLLIHQLDLEIRSCAVCHKQCTQAEDGSGGVTKIMRCKRCTLSFYCVRPALRFTICQVFVLIPHVSV